MAKTTSGQIQDGAQKMKVVKSQWYCTCNLPNRREVPSKVCQRLNPTFGTEN